MSKEKVTFEQFFASVAAENQTFVQELHDTLLENGCKVAFSEQKSGFLASYKYGKPPRAFANVLFRKQGMLVRIYGEHTAEYLDFLNTLPTEMVTSIEQSGVCKRIVENTCSPKCTGYDFVIGDTRFQKCKYNCFEFLVTEESKPYIKLFIQHELHQRM